MNIDLPIINQLRETAKLAALGAGEIVRSEFGNPQNIRQKSGPRDLVTETDYHAQEAILCIIRQRHPEHSILSEELPDGQVQPDGALTFPPGFLWVIDPLDGTTNFANSLPFVSVSVSVAYDGIPVAGAIYDPLRDEQFLAGSGLGLTLNDSPVPPIPERAIHEAVIAVDWAHTPGNRDRTVNTVVTLASHCRTVRSLGSAALGLAYVAVGRLQMYLNFGLKPWDTAAASVMLREAGCVLVHPDGAPWKFGEPAVFAGCQRLIDQALSLGQLMV
nr:inositol monophosphatase [Anaerolineae bacterium]